MTRSNRLSLALSSLSDPRSSLDNDSLRGIIYRTWIAINLPSNHDFAASPFFPPVFFLFSSSFHLHPPRMEERAWPRPCNCEINHCRRFSFLSFFLFSRIFLSICGVCLASHNQCRIIGPVWDFGDFFFFYFSEDCNRVQQFLSKLCRLSYWLFRPRWESWNCACLY